MDFSCTFIIKMGVLGTKNNLIVLKMSGCRMSAGKIVISRIVISGFHCTIKGTMKHLGFKTLLLLDFHANWSSLAIIRLK